MAKGKKRPWIQAKLAASTAADGDSGDGARLAEMERERRRRKAADRAARERAFRERHPERFVEDDSGDAPPGDVGDAGARASDATRDALDDARQPRPVGDGAARRGGGGAATSSRGRGDDQRVAHARPPRGYASAPPPPDERVDPGTLPEVKKWMRSREASLPPEQREQRRAQVEAITRQIAHAAQHKRLGAACAAYRRLVLHERLVPSSYTYAAMINAYVNSGHMRGAEHCLRLMRAVPGMAPNVVVYTTMLKGHMLAADVRRAASLLAQMPAQKPPIEIDARALNTFLRCCVRAGDTLGAFDAYRKYARRWDPAGGVREPDAGPSPRARVDPDEATYKLVAKALSQSLRVDDLLRLARDFDARAEALDALGPGGGPPSAPPCQFWLGGCCDRGAACAYFHDPAVTQRAALERLDAAAAIRVHLAHAHALLDDRDAAKRAVEAANEALDEAEKRAGEAASGGGRAEGGKGEGSGDGPDPRGEDPPDPAGGTSSATYKRTTRAELRLELRRVGGFLKRVRKGTQARPDLAEYLARVLAFSSRTEEVRTGGSGGSDGEADAPPGEGALDGDDSPKEKESDFSRGGEREPPSAALFRRLRDAYGLDAACRVAGTDPASVRETLRRVVSDGGAVDFERLFSSARTEGSGNSPPRQVKLEIAAGNGDWAVAQAKKDPESNWVALELRHDRVYGIFSRAVCEGARNLCAMGGDASAVVSERVAPESVSAAFVNFPEPPHNSGDRRAENRHHLLTPEFFERLHVVLAPGGALTVFSDNHPYVVTLAKTLAGMTKTKSKTKTRGGEEEASEEGEPMFAAEAAEALDAPPAGAARGETREEGRGMGAPAYENVDGVRVYRGLPGKGTGHLTYEQSYFDRFWEEGGRTERWFFVVSKN